MNKQNPNISFSVEGEKNDALPLVDRKIYIENGKFAPVSTGKKHSVILIQILPVLFHLNTSLMFLAYF